MNSPKISDATLQNLQKNWGLFKNEVSNTLKSLSAKDLDSAKENLTSIAGLLQETYGQAKEEVIQQVKHLSDSKESDVDMANSNTNSNSNATLGKGRDAGSQAFGNTGINESPNSDSTTARGSRTFANNSKGGQTGINASSDMDRNSPIDPKAKSGIKTETKIDADADLDLSGTKGEIAGDVKKVVDDKVSVENNQDVGSQKFNSNNEPRH
jgi:hypothetical protein